MLRYLWLILIIFCFTLPSISEAQYLTSVPEYNSVKQDSINPGDTIIQKKKSSKPFKMKKSPALAVVLSAVIPGAGQFYNESYWKIPIVLGVGGYLGYEIFRNNNRYNDYIDLYEQSQTPENPSGNLVFKQTRDNFRDKRDEFIIYFAIFYLINMVDAYVDAQLYDFDVSENVNMNMQVLRGTDLVRFNLNF